MVRRDDGGVAFDGLARGAVSLQEAIVGERAGEGDHRLLDVWNGGPAGQLQLDGLGPRPVAAEGERPLLGAVGEMVEDEERVEIDQGKVHLPHRVGADGQGHAVMLLLTLGQGVARQVLVERRGEIGRLQRLGQRPGVSPDGGPIADAQG